MPAFYGRAIVAGALTLRHPGLLADEEELGRVVEQHSWENIPEDEKGRGKFFRKAMPGSWQEDLASEQIETVERITAPILKEFYGDREARTDIGPA